MRCIKDLLWVPGGHSCFKSGRWVLVGHFLVSKGLVVIMADILYRGFSSWRTILVSKVRVNTCRTFLVSKVLGDKLADTSCSEIWHVPCALKSFINDKFYYLSDIICFRGVGLVPVGHFLVPNRRAYSGCRTFIVSKVLDLSDISVFHSVGW